MTDFLVYAGVALVMTAMSLGIRFFVTLMEKL